MVAIHTSPVTRRLAPLAVSCALILLGPPAAEAAGHPVQAALRQFKQELKANQKQFSEELKLLKRTLDQQLKLVDLDLKNGNADATDTFRVFSALDAFQGSVVTRQKDSALRFKDSLIDLNRALTAASVQPGDWPTDAQLGGNGAAASFDPALRRSVVSATESARKRALKTATRFRKLAGVGLNILVLPAAEPDSHAVFPSGTTVSIYFAYPLKIDVAVATRDLARGSSDGRLYLSGSARTNSALTLQVYGHSDVTPSATSGRWLSTFHSLPALATNVRLRSADTSDGSQILRIQIP